MGIEQPQKRLIEKQWLDLLIRLRGDITACPCGSQGFFSTSEIDGEGKVVCPCGQHYPKPVTLSGAKERILLFDGARLFDDRLNVTAEVVRNKNNPGLWGLKNLSDDEWLCTLPNVTEKVVPREGAAPIFVGTTVRMGENQYIMED